MSRTLAVQRRAIRKELDDLDPSNPWIINPDLDQTINRQMRMWVGVPPKRLAAFVTLVVGDHDYTLTPQGSTQWKQFIGFIYDPTGEPLDQVDEHEIIRRRSGVGTVPNGEPEVFAIVPTEDQKATLYVHPPPAAGATLTAIVQVMPATLALDADLIPFDEAALEGHALDCAREIALGMPEEERAPRGLTDKVLDEWKVLVEVARAEWKIRLEASQLATHVRMQGM